MSPDLDHGDVEELLGAYALDAVDPEERETIEAHLAGCARCRREVDEHRAVAAALGNDVAAPPPQLWDRIAGELPRARRPQEPSVRDVLEALGPKDLAPPARREGGPPVHRLARAAGRRAEPGAADPAHNDIQAHRRWGTRAFVTAVAGVAAALVAIALLAASLASTDSQLQQARQALGGVNPSAAAEEALAVPGHRVVELRSSAGTVLASAVTVPNGNGVLVSSMPALPAGKTYQLWAFLDGHPISLGLLGGRPRAATFALGSKVAPSGFAVTVEPAQGAAQPTTSPVAQGTVRA